ncbi:MAG TPA: hypothetical protein VG815_16600 [Chloroflexota bacterium]|nr:hypothetical protein [Chloroflexota bacterium]
MTRDTRLAPPSLVASIEQGGLRLATRLALSDSVKVEKDLGMLSYLEALTFTFLFEGKRVSPVLIYAMPDPGHPGRYIPMKAEDSGYEGIACVDDTARAALLALALYEQTKDVRALRLARRWLTFVEYMQYPDGEFANFVRNATGWRNASGPTSVKGGYFWTVRALWALARAYRVTGNRRYLRAYERCSKPDPEDGKIQAVLALGEAELFRANGSHRRDLLGRAVFISTCGDDYFRDDCRNPRVHLWGYHELHAVALAGRLLGSKALIEEGRKTVGHLVEPVIRDRFDYQVGPNVDGPALPGSRDLHGRKEGVCAYVVSPAVQGLAEMYRATGSAWYRTLALRASDWFFARNDARLTLYDPGTGLCSDGIDGVTISPNRGAESSIEAGLAQIERRELLGQTETL